jgi:hypothetical protein
MQKGDTKTNVSPFSRGSGDWLYMQFLFRLQNTVDNKCYAIAADHIRVGNFCIVKPANF